jgi:hypothetical protein
MDAHVRAMYMPSAPCSEFSSDVFAQCANQIVRLQSLATFCPSRIKKWGKLSQCASRKRNKPFIGNQLPDGAKFAYYTPPKI